MAITDTLTGIKDFFLNWHKDNYATLHDPIATEVTNLQPKKDQAVTGEAVYNAINNKFNNVNTCTVKQCNTKPAPSGSLQLTLDNFDTRINNIGDSIQLATPSYDDSYAMLTLMHNTISKRCDPDTRGFIWPDFVDWPIDTTVKAGLMSPEDKMNLYYATSWTAPRTGKEIGNNTTISNHLTVWVNYGLRLVYCAFEYKNCPWLKNAYKNNTDTNKKREYSGAPFTATNQYFYPIRPISDVWTATNYPHVRIGITDGGNFYMRSTEYITKSIDVRGSFMWFYQDGKPSLKMNQGGN